MSTPQAITGVLEALAAALTRIESLQGEGSVAMRLVQLVTIDIHDAVEAHQATPAGEGFDPEVELAGTALWLAAHRGEHPQVVEALTSLLAAATVCLRRTR